ncbi:ATP-binding protein [Pararhodonellum marinum]|uniref:ATP-binding protein n=1 Tax=Pararhodonellum marinum TaxID=2755358 RepID=UPI00293B9C75|nr:ATP-binding protein [Pararhodonellum marinum]
MDKRQITIDLICPDKVPRVHADNEKTAWVLTHLISNANRYSYDNSTIYLIIQDDTNKIKISVKDTDQGIAPQYKNKIFDRYSQLNYMTDKVFLHPKYMHVINFMI